jgi:hypothetical protein
VAEMEAHLESPWFAMLFGHFFRGNGMEMVWNGKMWQSQCHEPSPKSQGLYIRYKLQVDGSMHWWLLWITLGWLVLDASTEFKGFESLLVFQTPTRWHDVARSVKCFLVYEPSEL